MTENQNRIEYELRFLLFLKIVLNTKAVFSKVHKSYSVRNAFSVFFCNRSEYERCLFKFSRIVLSTKAVFYVFQNRSEYEMLFQKSKSYWKRILPPKAWISLLAEAHAERFGLQDLVSKNVHCLQLSGDIAKRNSGDFSVHNRRHDSSLSCEDIVNSSRA